jgi:hypothetical protein
LPAKVLKNIKNKKILWRFLAYSSNLEYFMSDENHSIPVLSPLALDNLKLVADFPV